MKKIMLSLGLMFAALTLTNCSNDIVENITPAEKGEALTIVANTPDTRTVADGLNTTWAANDKLSVFHVDGTTTKHDGAFANSADALNIFSGNTTADFTVANTWYALYPYNSYNTNSVTKTAYDNVGYATTTQKGNNSLAHVAGDFAPLYGITTTEAGNSTVSFTMHHLTSLVKFAVANKGTEAFTVKSINISNPQHDFVGTYHLNLTGEKVEYISSGAQYVSSAATLNVENGEAIAANGEAFFYLPIKPYTAAAGETITVTVTTDKGDYTKSLTLSNEVEFKAGSIKPLNINVPAFEVTNDITASIVFKNCGYANAASVDGKTIAVDENIDIVFAKGSAGTAPAYYTSGEAIRMYQGGATLKVTAKNGKTINKIKMTFASNQYYLKADCGELSAEGGIRTWTGEAGEILFTSTGTDKDHRAYISALDITYAGDTTTEPEPEEPEVPEPDDNKLTVAEFLKATVDANVWYELTGEITNIVNTSYGNFDLTDETGTVYVYGLTETKVSSNNQSFSKLGLHVGDIVTIMGTRAEYKSSAQVGGPAYYVSAIKFIQRDLKFSSNLVTLALGDEFTAPTLTGSKIDDVTYTSSDTAVAEVEASTGAVTIVGVGDAVITATAPKTTEYAAGSASYNITVSEAGSDVVAGGRDDFNTVATNNQYGSRKTTSGWSATNTAVISGGSSDSNPVFKSLLGTSTSTRAFVINGKTSAKGTITSPTLTTGCGTLSLNYGYVFSEGKAAKFKVEIKQNGAVVETYTVTGPNTTKFKVNTWTQEVNVAGDFQIVITNLCPSNSTSNKDRTAIWDVIWTGYNG